MKHGAIQKWDELGTVCDLADGNVDIVVGKLV